MSNLLIVGMDSRLLHNLKRILNNKKEADAINIISIFLEKHKSEISAVPFINERNHFAPKDLGSVTDIIQYYKVDNIRERVTNELTALGYNPKYKGTTYLIDTIIEICKNEDAKKLSLQSDFYPIIAKKYNKSVQNIKNCIKIATYNMYLDCDIETLKKYFHFYDDIRPTIRQVVFTVLDHIT